MSYGNAEGEAKRVTGSATAITVLLKNGTGQVGRFSARTVDNNELLLDDDELQANQSVRKTVNDTFLENGTPKARVRYFVLPSSSPDGTVTVGEGETVNMVRASDTA